VARIEYAIALQETAGEEIAIVTLTGPAEAETARALIGEMAELARRPGMLRILVDESGMSAGGMGFSETLDLVQHWRAATALRSARIAFVATHPIVRGLNQTFRLFAKVERTDSMSSFSKRADAVAWLVKKPDAR
jgi:hypothetical protein